MIDVALLSKTPMERWSATRQLRGTNLSEHPGAGMLLAAVAVLVLLTLLLCWVSRKRKRPDDPEPREPFAESASRRGLTARERQILLAIVVRSGLAESEDIFAAANAFDQGAATLQEECSRTRTTDENEKLRMEIATLRGKLDFASTRSPGGYSPAKRSSSRDIPVGTIIELTRRPHDPSSIHAKVIRNDDAGLAVESAQKLEAHAGDVWFARYGLEASAWEFDAAVVHCEGTWLILKHSDRVRSVDRRHFPRVTVHVPALLARLHAAERREGGAEARASSVRGPFVLEPPVFVQGVVAEIAGPRLRIEVPMEVGAGDRVLVLCQLDGAYARSGRGTPSGAGRCVISHIGRVQYAKKADDRAVVGVELGGLSEADIDELVRFAHALQSHKSGGSAGADPTDAAATLSHAIAEEGAA